MSKYIASFVICFDFGSSACGLELTAYSACDAALVLKEFVVKFEPTKKGVTCVHCRVLVKMISLNWKMKGRGHNGKNRLREYDPPYI